MARQLLYDRRFARRIFAHRKCRDSLLFSAEFVGLFSKKRARTFVAGTNPAAPDEKRSELDASCGPDRRLGSADVLPADFARRAAHS
jgi:hypothetical protein